MKKTRTFNHRKFLVIVSIENKSYINDPEGETIFKDLIGNHKYSENITDIRTAKLLKIVVNSEDKQEAIKMVKELCDDLRIYNPVVSDCNISAIEN